jgi:hypothetical protein
LRLFFAQLWQQSCKSKGFIYLTPYAQWPIAATVERQGAPHFGHGRGFRGRPPARVWRAACILRAWDLESLRIEPAGLDPRINGILYAIPEIRVFVIEVVLKGSAVSVRVHVIVQFAERGASSRQDPGCSIRQNFSLCALYRLLHVHAGIFML